MIDFFVWLALLALQTSPAAPVVSDPSDTAVSGDSAQMQVWDDCPGDRAYVVTEIYADGTYRCDLYA